MIELANEQNLTELFADLWPRGVEELQSFGLTKEAGLAEVIRLARSGPSAVLRVNGVPVFACGVVPDSGGWATWFQATTEFNANALKITRLLTKFARGFTDGCIYIYSTLAHPGAERWFNAMKFYRDGWEGQTVAGAPLIRFRRK